jgi:hypothetical protein
VTATGGSPNSGSVLEAEPRIARELVKIANLRLG